MQKDPEHANLNLILEVDTEVSWEPGEAGPGWNRTSDLSGLVEIIYSLDDLLKRKLRPKWGQRLAQGHPARGAELGQSSDCLGSCLQSYGE